MTDLLLVRRFSADYLRNGVNLLVLVVVPAVFVVVAAPALGAASVLLGGAGSTPVEAVTPGWAAGFLAAVAMYFQVSTARSADVRLAQAGFPVVRIVAARLATGAFIAVGVSAVALAALAARTGAWAPRSVPGTIAFAVIYLGVGAGVAATVRTAVNGTVLILFVWILDVFFGPSMSPARPAALRLMPTHLTTLWVLDTPDSHAGPLGNAGGMLVWLVLSSGAAALLLTRTVVVARPRARRTPLPDGVFTGGLRAAVTGLRRTPLLWALLVVVPAVFITLARAVTPHGTTKVRVVENNQTLLAVFDPARIHGALMAPIAVASLAALVGLFMVLDDRTGDRRLALAGGSRVAVVTSRLVVVLAAALGVTGVALTVAGAQFSPGSWLVYGVGNALVAITYGLVGVLVGPLLGRVAGVLVAFLVPFLDVGISQSPMLRAAPERWAEFLPGYGGVRMAVDGALTAGFDARSGLLAAAAWVAVLGLLVVTVLVRGLPRAAGLPGSGSRVVKRADA